MTYAPQYHALSMSYCISLTDVFVFHCTTIINHLTEQTVNNVQIYIYKLRFIIYGMVTGVPHCYIVENHWCIR